MPSAGGDPESRLGALHDPRAGAKHSPFQTSPHQELNQLKIRSSNVTKQLNSLPGSIYATANCGNGIGINIIWCIYLYLNIFLPDKSSILSFMKFHICVIKKPVTSDERLYNFYNYSVKCNMQSNMSVYICSRDKLNVATNIQDDGSSGIHHGSILTSG